MIAKIFKLLLRIFNSSPSPGTSPSDEVLSFQPSIPSAGEENELNRGGLVPSSPINQSSQTAAKVTFTCTSGALKGREFVFEERTTCILGRANDCKIQLPDSDISRYHCLLDINPPKCFVRDMGSLHGTYINGKLIGKRQAPQPPEIAEQQTCPECELFDGDEIKLISTVFKVGIQGSTQPNVQPINQQRNTGDQNLISVSGYTTRTLLGGGSCGVVYLARDDRAGELVAIKVMQPQLATKQDMIDRFLRETENTKALQHPHVVQLRDYGYNPGTLFFVMEYCNGGSITNLMQRRGGRLSVESAVPIILQVLDGLEYAHSAEISYVKAIDGISKSRGLVHRDIKPGNILLSNANGSYVAKICDFGLTKAFDLAGRSGLTPMGTVAGTPQFMCRQQVVDFKYAKPEVDLWASAASLYYMLTGAYPRDFISGENQLATILNQNPVPIDQREASIPKRLAELIDLALVDNPEIYFKNAAAFKQALLSVG